MQTLKIENGAARAIEAPTRTEISLDAWRQGARPEAGAFALALPNDADVDEVAGELTAFDAVALNFPAFTDGRAYSQARRLRDVHGYRGAIIARGAVLRDQAVFLMRTGFSEFEIGDADADGFAEALSIYAQHYQAGSDGSPPLWRLRADARAAKAA